MSSSVFPDINVWIALTLRTHQHHETAWAWYESMSEDVDLVFCRFTQLGLLRLLTTKSVAAEATMSQREAWSTYDSWLQRGGGVFREEPFGLEIEFRSLSKGRLPSPKEWADAYLAAFAASGSVVLVTFDRALSVRSAGSALLR